MNPVVNGLIQLDSEEVGGVKFSCLRYEDLSKIAIDPPTSGLRGVRQGVCGRPCPVCPDDTVWMLRIGKGVCEYGKKHSV